MDGDDSGGAGVVFSPDGEEVAVPIGLGVGRWQTSTWRPLPTLPISALENSPGCCGYTPDGRSVAVGSGSVFVFDRVTAELCQTLRPASQSTGGTTALSYNALAFSPDGKFLAVADSTGTVRVFAQAGGIVEAKALVTVRGSDGRDDGTQVLAFSPDSTLLAAGALGGDIELWDTSSWKPARTLVGRTATAARTQTMSTSALAFSPDARYIAGGLTALQVWNSADGAHLFSIDKLTPGGCSGLAFVGKSELLALDQQGDVTLWDVERQRSVIAWSAGDPPVESLAVSPDGRTILIGESGLCGVYALDPVAQ